MVAFPHHLGRKTAPFVKQDLIDVVRVFGAGLNYGETEAERLSAQSNWNKWAAKHRPWPG